MKKTILIISLLFSFFLLPKNTNAAEGIKGPDVIYKQASSVLLMSEVLNLYDYDGSPIILVLDDYTGNGDVPGVYQFKLKSGLVTKTSTIEVKNLLHNKITAVTKTNNDYSIHVNKNQRLTESDIVSVLERVVLYQVFSNDHVIKIKDTYTENYNSPGVYVFEMNVVNASGTSNNYSTRIVVSNDDKIHLAIDVIDLGDNNNFPYIPIILLVGAVILVSGLIFNKRR